MVLESIINPLKAEAHPSLLMIHGFVYASIGLILGLWIFHNQASLIMVFLTTMAAIPLIYNLIKAEEKKDLTIQKESVLLKEHGKALRVFMYYFIGATLGFAFWYVVIPSGMTGTVFEVQMDTITEIRSGVTGQSYANFSTFTGILSNNLKVLIFCILFSFLYGLGAIFILTWNASVIGVAIGDVVKAGIYEIGEKLHISLVPNYFGVITCGLFKFSIHGIPEILSYFVAGLAGGIISIAVIRHDFGTKRFVSIVMDSASLLLLSLGLLLMAAILEVFVTPSVYYSLCHL